jgi:hypothetical protein
LGGDHQPGSGPATTARNTIAGQILTLIELNQKLLTKYPIFAQSSGFF